METPNATQPETAQVAQVPTVSVQPVPPVKPIDKVKAKFNSYSRNTRVLIVLALGLLVILILLTILTILFGRKKTIVLATPSPSSAAVSPAPNIVLNASKYATDSGVLKIESDLNEFQKQLDASDVKQTDLTLPNLDFNINFNQ